MFLQGYPQALLPLTVAGIPSMHICLDFIPELLAQPQLEKQVINYQFVHPYFQPGVLNKSVATPKFQN